MASLVVKIGADLTDFSKKLNKMTKDVRDAAKTLSDVGTSLTLGITVPVGLATAALGHMALENEEVAKKMDQTFGPAAERMNAQLEEMMKIVPETGTEMQKMAVQANDMARGLGMSGDKSALLSGELMKMAANISASKVGVEMPEALDALEKGIMGQTRGLKSLGIVIDQAQIKQEAYRLGLLRTGQDLTPLGTALASYSLMLKQSAQFQGESDRVNQNASRQWKFLKRDLAEFADQTSNLLLPALRALIVVGRGIVKMMNEIPTGVREAVIIFAVLAATLGPTIIVIAKLTEAIMVLRTAMTLLAEGSALKKFLTALTNPEVLVAMAAIAIALGAAIALWKKFHKEVEETPKADLGPLADIKALLGGVTGMTSGDPLANLKKGIGELVKAFDRAVATGNDFKKLMDDIKDQKYKLSAKIVELSAKNDGSDAAREQLNVYQEMYDQLNKIVAVQYMMQNPKMLGNASKVFKSDESIRRDLVGQQVNNDVAIRTREAALQMANVFDATRIAALEMGEDFRRIGNDFKLSVARFKGEWKNIGGSAMAGLQAGVAGILDAFGPFALILKVVSKVMEGLEPFIEALFEPFVMLGRMIGIFLTPQLRILFQLLKPGIIALSYLFEVVSRITGGIASGIGSMLIGLGKLLNKLPGSIGNPLIKAGDGFKSFAADQYKSADEMKRARKELEGMSFEDAKNGIKDLGDAAKRTAEQLTNLPEVFKYTLQRYRAASPSAMMDDNNQVVYRYPAGPGTSASRTATRQAPDSTVVTNLVLNGQVVARVTLGMLRSAASRQFGDPNRINDLTEAMI
jgi:hypothetical protein